MYDKGTLVGSEGDVGGESRALWYDSIGNIVRGKADNALSNFCAGIGTIQPDYVDYCPDKEVYSE